MANPPHHLLSRRPAALAIIPLTVGDIRLGVRARDKMEAIQAARALLVERGYIDPAYVASMVEREAQADTILAGGVPTAADGALFLEDGRIVSATPPRVPVRTTAGAGGALLAGIVSARLRRLDLAELARLASSFALEAVTGRAAAEWLGEVVVENVG